MSFEDTDEKWLKKIDRQTTKLFDRQGLDRKTQEKVFDPSTLLVLAKLISDDVFETVDFPISAGKEAFVFRAVTSEKKFVAIKIYRTSALVFKQLGNYIFGDPRFENINKNRRNLVFEWAKKEYKNLLRIQKTQVKAPKPFACIKNVVVMQYIGSKQKPAPMLKDIPLENPQELAEQLFSYIKMMYEQAHLVHADFSAYNILLFRKKPYVIDFGQAVLLSHPQASIFLQRDIHNCVQFFKKYDLDFDEHKLYQSMVHQRKNL